MIKYIIISPVRNEEAFVESTIKSIINQTVKPLEWIIVNDGSTDSTREIIERYTAQNPWIKLYNLEDRGYYYPGTGVVNVVKKGFDKITQSDWEYIVKLDCDITVDPDYFEKIFNEFSLNIKLGIASGAIFLIDGEKEIKEKSQYDHPWGASKIYRKQCFTEINGWKAIPGWDLADLLSAQMKGWATRCFDEYKILHHRESGQRRSGLTSGKFLLGRFTYRFGYSFIYTVFKGLYRITENPVIIGGISIIAGYIFAFVKREDRLFDKEMRKFLRKKQRVYFREGLKRFFLNKKKSGK